LKNVSYQTLTYIQAYVQWHSILYSKSRSLEQTFRETLRSNELCSDKKIGESEKVFSEQHQQQQQRRHSKKLEIKSLKTNQREGAFSFKKRINRAAEIKKKDWSKIPKKEQNQTPGPIQQNQNPRFLPTRKK
jgi:hypothetical protein